MTTVVSAVERGGHDHHTREKEWHNATRKVRRCRGVGPPLVWLSATVQAQQTSAAHPEIEEQAMAVLQRMTAFLTQAQRFSVTVDTGFDGETRQMVLRRPDRLRIDVTKRHGAQSGMVFDGQDIAVFNTQENVYATTETCDSAICHSIANTCR